jgi:hypothetical protein
MTLYWANEAGDKEMRPAYPILPRRQDRGLVILACRDLACICDAAWP